ncbi:MAG: DNA polymerase III subunit alpha, partial [Clostridiales bacterium]|nr:DNA polymerase III subunit alpha [Clostridiales bacterium]
EGAKAAALEYKAMFAAGDFYIEIQDHGIAEQAYILPGLVRLAKEIGVKLVATNDVHYMNKEDSQMQKVMQCISFRRTLNDTAKSADGDDYFPTSEFYLKSYDEMLKVFPAYREALDNTLEVAGKCNVRLKYKQPLLPNYITPDNLAPIRYLRKLTRDGLEKKYGTVSDIVLERAETELSVIEKSGFVEYFLIVWDFITYAEQKGIAVGPGRGSGVGSIVAYAIGITKVEPLKHDLLFERFLNSERVSMPDFDIDFCVDRRGEVIEYVIGKYGINNVSQIVTFGTLAAKAAVKDVGRVFAYPYGDVNKITKAIPGLIAKGTTLDELAGKVKDAAKPSAALPELKKMYDDDPMVKQIIDMAAQLEGKPRQTGMHAAGVVICKDDISDHVPLQKSGDDVTTQYDMIEVEKIGLLKMDFLGLRTLTDIHKAQELIKKSKGIDINFYNMEYDDKTVYELIADGDTHAVFQLESSGMKRFMRQLKPDCLEDIIAGVSLYRPGPMDEIPAYVNGKNNPDTVKYDHPMLEPILKVTYGCLVYQEQVMRIAREMGGYTLGGADILRRIMSKKKKEAMAEERVKFIAGAVQREVSAETAGVVFDKIAKFAEYAFNKSHAAAYAYVTYQTAYLKTYYFVEYITAVLNNRITNIKELKNYLYYLKESGIQVLPPDVNKSETMFSVEDGKVRMGLAAIKNVGIKIMEIIVSEREQNGGYRDLADFVKRNGYAGLNKKMMESLILGGGLDTFGRPRSQLMAVYEGVVDKYAADRLAASRGQLSFFDALSDGKADDVKYPDIPEYVSEQRLKLEKDVLGVYVSGHPLDAYIDELKKYEYSTKNIRKFNDGDTLSEPELDGLADGDMPSDDGVEYLADGARVTL